MAIADRLKALREQMKKAGVTAYYIPTSDFHGSEYVGNHFKAREYISGFTGSAGIVVVTENEAGLWTDGRYFLQAEEQLAGSGITLYRHGQEGVPTIHQYLNDHLSSGQVLGCDGRTVTAVWAEEKRKYFSLRCDLDLVGEIWKSRPKRSAEPATLLDVKYAGVSREEKMKQLRRWIKEKKADLYVLTSLDDIAWLLNIRGNDIPCNPVVLSYLVVSQEEAVLFAAQEAFSDEVSAALAEVGVRLMDYEKITAYLRSVSVDQRVVLDKTVVNQAIVGSIPENVTVFDEINPTVLWKAVKNPIEIQNEREAHIRDGVAVTRFIYWLKESVDKLPLTELRAAKKLEEFRRQTKGYLGPSFDPIAGYGPHGAIVHYSADEKSDAALLPENFLLLDTGGQYLQGTTDVTRTVFLGEKATQEQKKYYTAVLRGNLNLCGAKFREGCSGVALDYLARQPLWEMGCDYNHGTGHGVGYLLNVHESPNAFRYRILEQPGENAVLQEGMITSDEPGIYLEGKYGIRLENLILCVKREKTEFGQFMGFEPLTFVPFERKAIDPEQMSEREKMLLNNYHSQVFETLSPYLSRQEKDWLQDECAPV